MCAGSSSGSGASRKADSDEELSRWRHLLCYALVLGLPVFFLHLAMSFMNSSDKNRSSNFFMIPVPHLCGGTGITTGQAIMVVFNIPMLFIVGYR